MKRAMPTRKAYVPVPPERPEVSVSRKANLEIGRLEIWESFAHWEIKERGKEERRGDVP
jgi:hypothetical protein